MIPGSAILTKVDKDGKTLAGAEFSVRDRHNNVIRGYEKLTTNDQGQIEAKDLRPETINLSKKSTERLRHR